MYHPYMHETAKQIVKERRDRADAARLAKLARGERTSLMSRVMSTLKNLFNSKEEHVRRQPSPELDGIILHPARE
jgi:hypothetical protein